MWRQRYGQSASRDEAQYRRGATLGLTFGEVFLLLSFILLLLLGLFEVQRRDERTLADRTRALEPLARSAVERGVSPDQLRTLVERLDNQDLMDVAQAARDIEAGRSLREKLPDLKPEEIALRVARTELPEVVDDYARSIVTASEKGFTPEEVASIVEQLEPKDIDFMRVDRALGERLRTMTQGVIPAELVALLELDPDKRRLAVEIARDTDDSTVARIREALGRDLELTGTVASAVASELGPLIAAEGGRIDPQTGSITLPEAILFGQGSAVLSADTRAFLDAFCPRWIGTVHDFGGRIAQLRIEGHSSSEWGQLAADAAYLENLNLSQQRSAAVVRYCLAGAMPVETSQWARRNLIAVGHSSARPVLKDGAEDAVLSRRVVFAFETDKDRVLDEIKQNLDVELPQAVSDPVEVRRPLARVDPDPEPTVEALEPLDPQREIQPVYDGPARVVAAGLLRMDDEVLRLEGLTPLALDATCEDASGTVRPCGRIAAMRFARWLDGASVTCTPVSPDRDSQGRIAARCLRGDSDIGSWLVAEGLVAGVE